MAYWYIDMSVKITKFRWVIAIISLTVCGGCSRKTEAPPAPPPQAQSAAQPTAAPDPNAGIDLAQMSRDLRRWILSKQRPPKNFEDYAATATAPIPTPPAGKKFAINLKDMSVVLVNK